MRDVYNLVVLASVVVEVGVTICLEIVVKLKKFGNGNL